MTINNIKNVEYFYNLADDKFTRHWFIYFILWPFVSFLFAVKNFKHPKAKLIFWFFCIYFGLVFIYDVPFSGGKDSAYYAGELISTHEKSISFENFKSSLYNPETNNIDLYGPIVIWIVALFTNEPRFLFMILAAVFGYFYAKNLWIIFDKLTSKVTVLLLLFMLAYALVNPIWNINGVRMWTAAQIFLYGNLRYFIFEEKKGLMWSISSVLVHFSFVLPILVLITYTLIPYKNVYVLFAIYIFTAFFSEIDLINLKQNLSFIPDFLQPRVNSYVDEERAVRLGSRQFSWHVEYASKFLKWIIYLWLCALFLKREFLKNRFPEFYRLFLFSLILGSFANLASYIPSGGRFHVLSNSLFLALFIILVSQLQIKGNIKFFKFISVPLLFFVILFNLRVSLDYVGVFTFIGNPIIAIFIELRTPLMYYIQLILGLK